MNWSIHFGDENLIDLSEQEGYGFPHPVQSWVMPVLALWFDDNKVVRSRALGTAFAIGPQLVATAKHVVNGIQEDGGILHLLFLVPEGEKDNPDGSTLIPITAVGTHDAFDVAVMSCAARGDGAPQPKFSCGPLTVRYPDVGTPLLTIGYAKSDATVAGADASGDVRIEVDQRVMASRGYVEEHHPEGRDSVMITFPAMQGDYPSLSGMSGGPVITETGQVCGVVSASADALNGSWTSTCSLLAPLFALRVQAEVDGVSKVWTIRELAERGIVMTDGSHVKVHSEWDPQANELRVTWSANP
jgi:S1-C subfamily serine protease